jgi:hypothetical protein
LTLLLLLLRQVNTLDPGTVNTKMLLAGWGRIGIDVGSANNTFKLLTDPNVADVTGGYFISHSKSRCGRISGGLKQHTYLICCTCPISHQASKVISTVVKCLMP